MSEVKLTGPQARALAYLATVENAAPSMLGQHMGGTKSGKAQGLGRLGGAMGTRLSKMGLARSARISTDYYGYAITPAGRITVAAWNRRSTAGERDGG